MSQKEQFLSTFEKEHERTMRVLRAYPADRLDLRPHPRSRTARELGWVFVLEYGLATMVYNDAFRSTPPSGSPPPPPETWSAVLDAIEKAHKGFVEMIRSTPDEKLSEPVRFFTGPKTMGDYARMEFLWFILHDQIHHRGQFSVYLRMADGKVPSIYGPSGDEPWM